MTKQPTMEGARAWKLADRCRLVRGGASRQRTHGQLKGEFCVVDDFYSTDDSVAVGPGEELRDGAFIHLLPALARIIQGRRLV